mgnify:CR=1 FL=1
MELLSEIVIIVLRTLVTVFVWEFTKQLFN